MPGRPAADGATTARTAAGDAGTGDASTTGARGARPQRHRPRPAGESSGIAAFLGLFVSIFQRISSIVAAPA